jgi:hypothetical protein
MTPRVGVAADGSFPEPEELAPAVRFWAATFTQYGQRDVVIHDREQLGLVYDVVRDVSSSDDPRVQRGSPPRSSGSSGRRRAGRSALFQTRAPALEPLARIPDDPRTARVLRAGPDGRTVVSARLSGARSRRNRCR